MTPLEQIQSIAELLQDEFNGFVTWEDPLTIRDNNLTVLVRLYGAACNLYTEKEVFLLDNNGEWNKLEAHDRNIEFVAPGVLHRLQFLKRIKGVKLDLWKK